MAPVGQLVAGRLVWLLGIILAAIGTICFSRLCQISTEGILGRLVLAIRRKVGFLWHSASVTFFEARKLLLHQRRWLLLAALALYVSMAVGNAMEPLRFAKPEDAAYHRLMKEAAGPVTEETREFLDGKQQELDTLYERFSESVTEGEQVALMSEISALEGGCLDLRPWLYGRERPNPHCF